MKICTAPNIKSWNFRKNKVVLLMWIINLKCPYYHKLKVFLRKYSFNDITWKFDMPLLSRAAAVHKNNPGLMKWLEYLNWLYFPRDKILEKIRQFRWCDLQRWLDPIIASWNVCKSKAFFKNDLKKSIVSIITS